MFIACAEAGERMPQFRDPSRFGVLAPLLREERITGQLSAHMNFRRYLATLSTGRLILWCYFIWYLVVLVRYFDPSARLWLTSLGLSVIIGFALYLSTAGSGTTKVRLDRWQVFRLFLMPFCVSSFAALVKGKGFMLIFSPQAEEIMLAVALCALLCLAVFVVKRFERR
jgi:hypothetical protein